MFTGIYESLILSPKLDMEETRLFSIITIFQSYHILSKHLS